MENEINVQPASPEPGLLRLSDLSKTSLRDTSKWTLFFSILGFILIAILVLAGFFLGTFITRLSGQENNLPLPGFALGIIYAFFGAIYFPPILFLYRFSKGIKKAFAENNESSLDTAFLNLKSHYQYIGILTIIMLAIYLIVGIIAGIVALLVS